MCSCSPSTPLEVEAKMVSPMRAAELLGMSRPTLYDLMDRLGMRRGDEPE